MSGPLHTPDALPPGKSPRYLLDRAGPDDVEKRKFLTLPGLELRPPGRRSRSQSLYRLRYPGSIIPGDRAPSSNWMSSRAGLDVME
jgi:hypothetical protein